MIAARSFARTAPEHPTQASCGLRPIPGFAIVAREAPWFLTGMKRTMKYVLIIPDGVADEPQSELDGQTPLEAASTPNADRVVREGRIGRTNNVPASMPSGSDVGTMSLFGYDPLVYHRGRAALEAAAQGIRLGPDDWAVRCNLVTVLSGRMESFTAHQINSSLAAQLIEHLQRDQCGSRHWKFHAGVSYRNLLIYRAQGEPAPFGPETVTIPPHDLTGQAVVPPSGPGAEVLRELMRRSVEIFQSCDLPEGCEATQIWLWGQGQVPQLGSFRERFGIGGAVITAVDLLRGLGRILGWEIIDVPTATGYTDTDYAAKGAAAVEALTDHDLVVVHVEATDEASHEGDVAAKVTAMERIDADIIGPVHEALRGWSDYRLLICPDHPTFLRTRTHSHGFCPFAVCGNGISPDSSVRYAETASDLSSLVLDAGHELMPMFLEDRAFGEIA